MADSRITSLIEDIDRQIRLFRARGTFHDLDHLEKLVLRRDNLHQELRRLRNGGRRP